MDMKEIMDASKLEPQSFAKGYVRLPGLGIGVLFGSFFIMLLILSVITALLTKDNPQEGLSLSLLRIMTVTQDIFVFVLPAVLAAFSVTRLPATFLTIDRRPKLTTLLLACVVLITAIPALDWIVALNESIQLPESLSGLEQWLRSTEDAAAGSVKSLLGSDSFANIIISILIVGVLTGFAEELFFRGALQNLFFSTRMKKHLAVWLVAIIFSFMHFQFYGFIPRMLLGVYFGYLLWWGGSVWIPIAVHALNNSLVVIFEQLGNSSETAEFTSDAMEQSITGSPLTIGLSFIVAAFGIYILHRRRLQ